MKTTKEIGRIRHIANYSLVLGLLAGILLIGFGFITNCENALVIALGVIILLLSIVIFVAASFLQIILQKLDNLHINISYCSIRELSESLNPKSNDWLSENHSNQETIEELRSDGDETIVAVLKEIIAGNPTHARLLLMTRKGLTHQEAMEYIETIERKIH